MAKSDALSLANFSGMERYKKGKSVNAPEVVTRRWWALPDEGEDGSHVAQAIETHIQFLQEHQMARIRQMVISARLYGNATLAGISGFSSERIVQTGQGMGERMTDNVIASLVDTATARIGQNKPRPYYLTSGGSYKLQRRAKRLNKGTEGIFYENKSYRKGAAAQRDAEIFGDGFLFVTKRFGRVVHERVLGSELWVDELEAMYGSPRQLHWVRSVDRQELIGLFPDKEDIINEAARTDFGKSGPSSTLSDMITVRESWHLRSGPESNDGKHTVSIAGKLLDPVTEWDYDFFPFAHFKWAPKPLGFWSQGIPERQQNKQIEVNKILWIIQRAIHLASGYKVLLEDGSKIVTEHINNDIGAIIKYRGTKPEWVLPAVVPMEYYQHYATIVESMYEREGLSIQAATGQKPAGLNSGEAQRVYRDTVNERSKSQEELNEDAYMDLARISIAMAREIALEEGGAYEVRAPSGRVLTDVKLTAKDLDPSGWEMQCFPTSSLPRDPAGRLQTITEYIQAGFMTPRQGRRALDFPDLEATESLANAAEDLISMVLDAICDDHEYEPPEPTFDLKLSREMVVEYINRGIAQDLDDDALDLLRTWSAQIDAIVTAMTPPAPPPMPMAPGPMPGPPGAMPMPGGPQAPPQPMAPSPLVPNVPMAA